MTTETIADPRQDMIKQALAIVLSDKMKEGPLRGFHTIRMCRNELKAPDGIDTSIYGIMPRKMVVAVASPDKIDRYTVQFVGVTCEGAPSTIARFVFKVV